MWPLVCIEYAIMTGDELYPQRPSSTIGRPDIPWVAAAPASTYLSGWAAILNSIQPFNSFGRVIWPIQNKSP